MSLIGQQIASAKLLDTNKKLVELVDNNEEINGFSVIPYHPRGIKLTQEYIDKMINTFVVPNCSTYLIHLNTPTINKDLSHKIKNLQGIYKNRKEAIFTLKPGIKIASTYYYFKHQGE